MRSSTIVPTTTNDVTDATLKSGPTRLLAFLQGVANPGIRAKFAALGWSERRLEEAWALLAVVKEASVLASSAVSDPVTEAIAACEEWQSVGLVRARAMLQLSSPAQAGFMFQDLVAGKGAAAVFNVSTFLGRRQALEDAGERKANRKADHEALDVLEEAGVTAMVIKSLEGHVDTVHGVVAAPRPQRDDAEAMLLDGLRKIDAWLSAWIDMARTVITRRDQLIRLGIVKRRPRKDHAGAVAPPMGGVIAPPVAGPVAPLSGIILVE